MRWVGIKRVRGGGEVRREGNRREGGSRGIGVVRGEWGGRGGEEKGGEGATVLFDAAPSPFCITLRELPRNPHQYCGATLSEKSNCTPARGIAEKLPTTEAVPQLLDIRAVKEGGGRP